MRNSLVKAILALSAVSAFSSIALAQRERPLPPGFIREGVPKMPNPPGPAPKRDLSGAWVGPQNFKLGPVAPLTPAGQAIFKQRYPYLVGNVKPEEERLTSSPLHFALDAFLRNAHEVDAAMGDREVTRSVAAEERGGARSSAKRSGGGTKRNSASEERAR